MQVTVGTRLGPYEVLSPLGVGGMGEVWRARDTRLDRNVALKVLPAELAQNAVLRVRFDREARAISQLNHPHICTIHDVGHEEGTDYIVMELLEGESLADRIARGPLPVPEVLRLAIQIAEALDRAHRSGIVHRDLKPANVMITKEGAKLLDFGLARNAPAGGSRFAAGGELPAEPGDALAPTMDATRVKPLTEEGTVVGTFQYMAPEQLAGEEADTRTDIFAFGAVVYEMLTGHRAFQGKTRTSLVAAIVGSEPQPVSEVRPLSPPALDHVIARCLAKDPESRWQSAHDIAEELRWISEAGSHAGVAAPLALRRKQREWILAASSLLLLILSAVLGWALWRGMATPVMVQRSFVAAPRNTTFVVAHVAASALSISPDGRYATFAAAEADGTALWLYSFETGESRRLARGHSPFWSPDSKSVAFWSDKLRRVEISGGPAVAVADGDQGRGGAWGPDGTIIYEPHWREPLYRVSVNGGPAKPLTTLDAQRGETTHRWPFFLPDGRHFLYLAGSHLVAPDSDVNAIFVGSLDSPDRKLLLHARSNAVYANGHILFVRDNHLLAQPFDPKKLELSGEPRRVAQDVTTVPGYFRSAFAASTNGMLVYFTGAPVGRRAMKWTTLANEEISTIAELDFFGSFLRVSPDGTKAAITVNDPWDLWIIDLERGTPTRFTADPMQEFSPVWAPDGSRIAFASDRRLHHEVYVKPVDGLTRETLLFARKGMNVMATDWSGDGKVLFVDVEEATTTGAGTPRESRSGVSNRLGSDIWVVPVDGSEPYPFIETEFAEYGARLSPDGRWLAYISDESGTPEIYAVPFPDRGVKKQLTNEGVLSLQWERDGKSITFTRRDRTVMSLPVAGDRFGSPRTLFTIGSNVIAAQYVPDPPRVLTVDQEPIDIRPITVVNNWMRAIRDN